MQGPLKSGAVELELAHLAAVDLDDRDPLEVRREQAIVGIDVDLAKVDLVTSGQPEDLRPSLVAQVAVRTPVERDYAARASQSRKPG